MAQDISKENVRLLLSEILKILATSEYQTQLEKTRQTSANDAVALLQNVKNWSFLDLLMILKLKNYKRKFSIYFRRYLLFLELNKLL